MSEHARKPSDIILLSFLILAFILIPLALFGAAIEAAATEFLRLPHAGLAIGAVGALILAADAALPVPSSLVATLLGLRLGFWGGALASGAGLSAGAVLGLALGRGGRAAFPDRLVRLSPDFDAWVRRYGLAALLICRPVPVLAEASLIAAGLSGVRLTRLLGWLIPAQFCLGAVYAAAGAAGRTDPASAWLGAIGVPAVFAALALAAAHRARETASG